MINFHGSFHFSSPVFPNALRAFAAPSSNIFTNSCADCIGAGLKFAFDKSNSELVNTLSPNAPNDATRNANRPIGIDFGCGTKSGLSTGTRSSTLLVNLISSSNSVSNSSLIFTFPPGPFVFMASSHGFTA